MAGNAKTTVKLSRRLAHPQFFSSAEWDVACRFVLGLKDTV